MEQDLDARDEEGQGFPASRSGRPHQVAFLQQRGNALALYLGHVSKAHLRDGFQHSLIHTAFEGIERGVCDDAEAASGH